MENAEVALRGAGHGRERNQDRWAAGLVAFLLAAGALGLVHTGPGAEDSCLEPANEIVAENCLPGNPASEWDVQGAGDLSIQGFATDISINKGQTVEFKIDTDASAYHLDIYRLGYYGGDGARRVAANVRPSATLPQLQPPCLSDSSTGLVDCGNWAVSAAWSVPPDAVSGIYLARLVREDRSGASHVIFVVRDDSSTSDVVFQTSDTTWQAYNRYGGNSLYTGSPAGRAFKVSYNRPFTTRAYAPEDWVFNAEMPMVRWLEANGYDVSYLTGVDSDRRGEVLANHQVFLSVGHDEYWSADQRAHVEAARDQGVHLGFFSGNEVFWKVRWEQGFRTLVCYKETHANAKIDPLPGVWTGTWRDSRAFNPEGPQPENALTGTIFTVNSGSASLQVPAAEGKLRLWRNTGLENLVGGQVATLAPDTVGYEWDEDLDNGFRPEGQIRLSLTRVDRVEKLLDNGSTFGPGNATHTLTLHRHPSGALVFGAGTVQWSWGLDSTHDRGGAAADPRMQQATVNLLADMGTQPGSLQSPLVAATASTDTTPPLLSFATPANGTTLPAGPMTVTGVASDVGGRVGAVEVSLDGLRWHPAQGREVWSYSFNAATGGPLTVQARAIDDSGNLGPVASLALQVDGGAAGDSARVWNDLVVPTTPLENDSQSIEVGVKFFADIDGFVTGLRFYRGAGAAGAQIGHLWTSTGSLLAEIPFPPGTAAGWQEVALPTAVPITAGTVYVASYHSPSGDYAVDEGFFTVPLDVPPLHLPADGGAAGANGVFRYGPSGFPTETFAASNYWVDVVFRATVGPDVTRPTVVAVSPANGASGVPLGSPIIGTFSEAIAPASLVGAFELRDDQNALVPASIEWREATRQAVLTPNALLRPSTTYSARLLSGILDLAGNGLAADRSWSFTTAAPPPPPPDEGPGGPILVISSAADPFTRYTAEILRAEGLNAFLVRDISTLDAAALGGLQVAILGAMPLTAGQVSMLTAWVEAGGKLVALRPDPQLAPLLGLQPAGGTVAEGYLRIDTTEAPGRGLVGETIQFHGIADRYSLAGARAVARLHTDAITATDHPAVSLRQVGAQGGAAAAFSYDLSRSVVFTRQGNPAWAGQERDGTPPIRPDDLFFGGASTDWVDLGKVAIPQADEQQRLLANLLLFLVRDQQPIPRFWYFPRGEKAVVILTGDDHGSTGAAGRVDRYLADSPPGCSVADWECIRASIYLYPTAGMTNQQAAAYHAAGFEIGLHVNTGCGDWTPESLEGFYSSQLASWSAKYASVPPPVSERTHCIAWSDWASQPKVQLAHGIRLDTNYYYWPPTWVNDRPGFFTGSGMPMRFADLDGTLLDVYQAVSQMTDESGQSYPFTIDRLLDGALGPDGYYGAFTANMHVDVAESASANAIVASAKARGVPVVSGRQMLEWLDGRNGSLLSPSGWDGSRLSFDISVGAGANGLHALLPTEAAGARLISLTRGAGVDVSWVVETIKGIEYARFPAAAGAWEAVYAGAAATGFVDTTVADFSAGTPGADLIVTQITDGELLLAPSASSDFFGVDLPPGFASLPWNPGGAATVSAGLLRVDGARVQTDGFFSVGRSLEFVATFGGATFQNAGLAQTFEDAAEPWISFGTANDPTQLLARVNLGGPGSQSVDTPLGTAFTGAPHRFRIDWTGSQIVFSIDGTVVHTAIAAITAELRPVFSDFATGGPALQVDWLRLSPYSGSGTFLSRIFDGGQQVDWGSLAWTAATPPGTTLVFSVRTGDTALPDASWTPFTVIGQGGTVGQSSRYLQYRAVFESSDNLQSPLLERVEVGFGAVEPGDPPVCVDGEAQVDGDRWVLANLDCGGGAGGPLAYRIVSEPGNGLVFLLDPGRFLYLPNPGFSGSDSFTFTASDGSLEALPARFTLQVQRERNEPPVARDDFYTVEQGQSLEVAAPGLLVNDSDPDGDPLEVIFMDPPAHGILRAAANGAFVYVPLPGFHGSDFFRYQISDGTHSSTAIASITVQRRQPTPPIAGNDRYEVNQGGRLTISAPGVLGNDLHLGGSRLAALLVTGPFHGDLTLAPDGSFIYIPDPRHTGGDAFTYEAMEWRDQPTSALQSSTAIGTVLIQVHAVALPVVAMDDSYTVERNGLLQVAAPGILANDRDPLGGNLMVSLVRGPRRGTLHLQPNGAFSYRPSRSYEGSDSFEYRASNGREDATATVRITVKPRNRGPLVWDQSYRTNRPELAVEAPGILAGAWDPDGDRLTAVLVSQPSRGSVRLHADGGFVYTPRRGFFGTDRFRIRVSDGKLQSGWAWVKIDVQRPTHQHTLQPRYVNLPPLRW